MVTDKIMDTDSFEKLVSRLSKSGMYWKLDGKKLVSCNVFEWSQALAGDRHVGNDMIYGCHVSTVFLGMDHGSIFSSGERRPILFETMIFGEWKHKEWYEKRDDYEYQERYCTWDEAAAGHTRAVNMVVNEGRKPMYEDLELIMKIWAILTAGMLFVLLY